jgi:MraZ protein
MQRAVLGNTYEVLMDKQGRINIPVHLLRNTPIKKDVVVVGMFNRIEI